MTVKFKKLSDKAVMPVRAHKDDAGVDLTATAITTEVNEAGQLILVYHTDLAVEIPEGYVGFLMSRSGIFKKSLAQTNCVGVIDSNYRGELIVKFRSTTDVIPAVYKEGERFAQLVIVPYLQYDVEEAEELSEGERGTNGLGSTGTAPLEDMERSSASAEVASEQAAEDQSTSEQAQ
jgi:dUTP pyrophosphatase